ncbi:MAG: hypothetical protein V1872_04540 [bacterium]
MIDTIVKYQASIFVNAKDITPSPDNITNLINIFRDREFIPNTFNEIAPTSLEPQTRLLLTNSTNEWKILFASSRIDIEKIAIEPKGNNMGELSVFCADVIDFFGRILTKYNKKSNRLSLSTNFLLKEMTDVMLSNIYLKLFKPSKFYQQNSPFEWDWRSVSRVPIKELKDELNVISNIKRIRGNLKTKTVVEPFDRIEISLDINTIKENSEHRFELNQIKKFYEYVLKLHNDMLKELMEFIHG